jgi:carotenoid 1,2-hydratase
MTGQIFALDAAERHTWSPLAPCARIQVRFETPDVRWMGDGYLDMNAGDRPLEQDFSGWQWSRAKLKGGTAIVYAAERRQSGTHTLGLFANHSGQIEDVAPGPIATLPPTKLWRIKRSVPTDPGAAPRVLHTLEDTPFYARSLVSSRVLGERATLMHESLSLDRFRTPLVQAMLPFRMPRPWR